MQGGRGNGSFWKVLGPSRVFVQSYFDTVLVIARAIAVFRWVCSENIVYSFVVGCTMYLGIVVVFIELVCVDHVCSMFVQQLPDLHFVNWLLVCSGTKGKLNIRSSLDVHAQVGMQRRSRI